jgi:two-component system, LytTR family, sensor kinase
MLRIKGSAIMIHIAGWFLFLSLPLLFQVSQGGSENPLSSLFLPGHIVFYSCYILLFYFNYYLLIPQLYLQKKYIMYFNIILLLLLVIFLLKPFDQLLLHRPDAFQPPMQHDHQAMNPPPTPGQGPGGPPSFDRRPPQRIDFVSIFLFIMIVALSMAVRISRQLQVAEQRATRAEADRAHAELSFLKAQINPHFLFNTLNNIYTLAVTKNEDTAESIMKLSNIMRYLTDDITADFVSLESEVNCVSDYIELQRLRLGKHVQMDYQISGNLEHRKIAPLILMTFVENVFKYGISNHEPSPISIKLFCESHTITFFTENRIFAPDRKEDRSGIGIQNARQRLEFLYPTKHFLNITTDKGLYAVQLTLQV